MPATLCPTCPHGRGFHCKTCWPAPARNVDNRNPAYLEAHATAVALLKAGEIRAYSATHHATRGRVIHIETWQGWDPDPMYQDHPDD